MYSCCNLLLCLSVVISVVYNTIYNHITLISVLLLYCVMCCTGLYGEALGKLVRQY